MTIVCTTCDCEQMAGRCANCRAAQAAVGLPLAGWTPAPDISVGQGPVRGAIRDAVVEQIEYITHVAIKFIDDGTTIQISRPCRHHNIINALSPKGEFVQGFWTNRERFVDREEALGIAAAAGQIKVKTQPERLLFSEDIW